MAQSADEEGEKHQYRNYSDVGSIRDESHEIWREEADSGNNQSSLLLLADQQDERNKHCTQVVYEAMVAHEGGRRDGKTQLLLQVTLGSREHPHP